MFLPHIARVGGNARALPIGARASSREAKIRDIELRDDASVRATERASFPQVSREVRTARIAGLQFW
jgi:hypothetical protein